MKHINSKKMREAYFISPDGIVYDVPLSHINFLAENTELFGISREDYLERYRVHNEKIGLEGKGRRELMAEAIEKGWIRCRLLPKFQIWIVELFDLNEKTKQNLNTWAKFLSSLEGVAIENFLYKMNLLCREAEPNFYSGAVKDYLFSKNDNQ